MLPAALKWRIYSVRLFLRPVVEGTSVPSLEGGGGPGKGLMEGGFFLLMPPPPNLQSKRCISQDMMCCSRGDRKSSGLKRGWALLWVGGGYHLICANPS